MQARRHSTTKCLECLTSRPPPPLTRVKPQQRSAAHERVPTHTHFQPRFHSRLV